MLIRIREDEPDGVTVRALTLSPPGAGQARRTTKRKRFTRDADCRGTPIRGNRTISKASRRTPFKRDEYIR